MESNAVFIAAALVLGIILAVLLGCQLKPSKLSGTPGEPPVRSHMANRPLTSAEIWAIVDSHATPTHDEGAELRKRHPNLSWCHRCGKPWAVVDGHTIYYSESEGCFPVCEGCWEKSELNERLALARMMIDGWKKWEGIGPFPGEVGEAERKWTLIEKAILDEWNTRL